MISPDETSWLPALDSSGTAQWQQGHRETALLFAGQTGKDLESEVAYTSEKLSSQSSDVHKECDSCLELRKAFMSNTLEVLLVSSQDITTPAWSLALCPQKSTV